MLPAANSINSELACVCSRQSCLDLISILSLFLFLASLLRYSVTIMDHSNAGATPTSPTHVRTFSAGSERRFSVNGMYDVNINPSHEACLLGVLLGIVFATVHLIFVRYFLLRPLGSLLNYFTHHASRRTELRNSRAI
jgi:hypothetical protein